MIKRNEERVDNIIDILLTQFETIYEEMSFDTQKDLAETILALEKAKTVGNPKMMNWGTVNVHQATYQDEINNIYTNGGKTNGN